MADSESIDVAIPQEAVEVKVVNIINPYFIRIYGVLNYHNEKNNLCRKLEYVLKHQLRKASSTTKFSHGDNVILSTSRINDKTIDLPDWISRGVITYTTEKVTDVFLLDYGRTIRVPTESLVKYSRSAIKIETLTSTVGLYNILPVDSKQLCRDWPKSTTDFVKELIVASRKIYFQVLASDIESNNFYGDLFLMIENKNVSLSKVLIHSLMAVTLNNELLEVLKNKENTDDTEILYNLGEKKTIESNSSTNDLESNSSSVNERRKRSISKKKQANEKVLIRSKLKCQPLQHIADSRFPNSIHKALANQGIRTLKQIYTYMWPSIKQGLHVAVISPNNSGKTVGYAVPIISNIVANEESILMKDGQSTMTKPVALILCATVTKCIDVVSNCKDIAYFHPNIKSFAAFSGLTEKQIMTNICNKFQILVSTPSFLVRILEKYSNKLDLSELSYLVLDHADIVLSKYIVDLSTLIKKYKIINKEKNNGQGSLQIITSADIWTDKLSCFINRFMEDPYICIASFTEAAAFCKIQAKMSIRHSEQKKREVLKTLGDYSKVKTMIFCISCKEAIELNSFLVSNSIETLLVHQEMEMVKIHELKEDWSKYLPGMYPVIICTDEVLSEFPVSNVEFLIHYTITATSKTEFNRRFSVFMDNWLLESKTKCKVLILFDETRDSAHFKGVVDILKRLNVELPHDWAEIANGLDLANNLRKKNYPLCDFVKLFGICEVNSCPERHRVIAEVDGPSTQITIGDWLKLQVTYEHNASHFSARVMECTRKSDTSGKEEIIKYPCDILKLDMEMKKYYSNSNNKKMLKDVIVGDICALRDAENKFSRVKILNILESNIKTEKPTYVKVQSLDDGRIFLRVSVVELYVLPQELLQYQTSMIDIYITGVAPFDGENKWTEIANKEAQKWFKSNINEASYVSAKTLLHLGHSVWTDTLVVRTKLTGFPDLISASLSDVLKKREHGTENKQHINNLLQLCHSGDLKEINGRPIQLPSEENDHSLNDISLNECD